MAFHFTRPSAGFTISSPQLTIDIYCALNSVARGTESPAALRATLPATPPALPTTAEGDWAIIRKLNWHLRSDGIIGTVRVSVSIRNALARRAAQIPTMDRNLAWQVAALGPETVAAVIESPSLLEYIVQELQPCDLDEIMNRGGP
jgi:hypothetical protein